MKRARSNNIRCLKTSKAVVHTAVALQAEIQNSLGPLQKTVPLVIGQNLGADPSNVVQTSFPDRYHTTHNLPKKFATLQWECIQQRSKDRKDLLHPCPICLERFGLKENQVILSCSHVFHKLCLQSFEKFSRYRCCPVCRAEPYQKNLRISLSKTFCATRLETLDRVQAAYRGYQIRRKYSHLLPHRRQCFFNMLVSSTDHLLGQLGVHDSEIDELFKEIDETISKSNREIEAIQQKVYQELTRPTIQSCYPKEKSPPIDWQTVIFKALERHDHECPICIAPLQRPGTSLAWLSCSHVFHRECITAFEAYNKVPEHTSLIEPNCPICRRQYQRLEM